MKIEEEFDSIDQAGSWAAIYHKIRQETLLQHEYSVKDSKRAEFKGRNRYRDVSPYDHSRVKLAKNDLDYINASLIEYPAAERSYILTQGPLPNTASHFWLMIWENNSKAILMLNRIIEKGQIKCHQYFPMGSVNEDEEEIVFEDVGLKVTYIGEENANFFVVRVLEITELETQEKKRVLQYHYITWPDFGVPESPKEFLHFLLAVRDAGVLEPTVGPAVIHCSAGIGRSGTFCLVDTCLVLLEKQKEDDGVRVCDVLMEMRRYRMGLIQTADQLRFSYMAIIEGWRELSSPKSKEESENIANEEKLSNEKSCVQNGDDDDDDAMDIRDITLSSLMRDSRLPNAAAAAATTDHKDAPGQAHGNGDSVKAGGDDTELNANKRPQTTTLNDVIRVNSTLRNGVPEGVDSFPEMTNDTLSRHNQEVRRRNRDDRKKKTSEQISLMRRKQQECENWKIRRQKARPYVWGVSLAVLVGSYLIYHYYF